MNGLVQNWNEMWKHKKSGTLKYSDFNIHSLTRFYILYTNTGWLNILGHTTKSGEAQRETTLAFSGGAPASFFTVISLVFNGNHGCVTAVIRFWWLGGGGERPPLSIHIHCLGGSCITIYTGLSHIPTTIHNRRQ